MAHVANDSLLKVYLRLRNSKTPHPHADVYYVDEPGSLVATAPEHTETHKNAQRNHTLSVQKFKFSKIFLPSTSQTELFENTTLPMLDECLNMENNVLLFTYGVTNSGKTHTVQGPRHDAGLLPRSLDLIFNTLGSHIKPKSIYCPNLHNDVCKMTEKLQQQREQLKQRILFPQNMSQEFDITGMTDPNSTKCTVGTIGSMVSECTASTSDENTSYHITDNVTVQLTNADNVQYSVWVSYLELYNENIYDLLHPPPEQGEMKPRDRPTLRMGEDHNMSVYVKGATHLEVCSFAEANRVLAYGQRNRKKAATSMNQSSSRSHAIFKITVIATNTISLQSKCSQMTFVDLAGSERYGKTNAIGVRLKEAGNINTSLLTLGKCITSLKHNSKLRPNRSQAQIVPFRESKLTRLFKGFLSGDGLIAMIVCVNPNPEFFDESIHALKFSALATEALLLPRPPAESQQPTVNHISEKDVRHMREDIRTELLQEFIAVRRKARLEHEEEMEELKERERGYYEDIEKGLQDYYAGVIEELKEKVRAARAEHGGQIDRTSEETISALQEQCATLKEELKTSKAVHTLQKGDLEQRLIQSNLELKMTQQLHNDGNEEKERFAKLLTDKELEIKNLFLNIEESTKLATFWEKEWNDLKKAHALQIEELQIAARKSDVKERQFQEQLMESKGIIEQMSRDRLEHAQQVSGGSLLQTKVDSLTHQLIEEKQANMDTLEKLDSANTLNMDLDRSNKDLGLQIERLKSSAEKDQKQICQLKQNSSESAAATSTLKTELQKLQKVLSHQENKENVTESEGVRSTLLAHQEQLLEKNNLIGQLQEELLKKVLSHKDNVKESEGVRSTLLAHQEQLLEKNSLISELQEELADIVRNKSLQFDTLICNKEKECEDLEAQLEVQKDLLASQSSELEQLQLKIRQLQDLAAVQKGHLASVEEAARAERVQLEQRIAEIEEQDATPVEADDSTSHLGLELTRVRVEQELIKQEADRLKIELAAANRKITEEAKKFAVTLDAKNIELENWYSEKEKAISLISSKKEKEISVLEEQLKEKETLIQQLEKNSTSAGVPATQSDEYLELSEESKRKLTEMADMVIQIESDKDDALFARDELRAEYDAYKETIEEGLSEKQETLAQFREEVEKKAGELRQKEARNTELEETVATLKKEIEAVVRKRGRQISTDVELDEKSGSDRSSTQSVKSTSSQSSIRSRTLNQSRDQSRTLNQSRDQSRTLNQSRDLSSSSRRTSRRSSEGRSRRVCVKTSTRRTSQVLLTKAALNTTRSKRSRVQTIPESPSSDFATPESVGIKRKATLKGLKNMIRDVSPRLSKRGKKGVAIVDVSSDSDFATPTQPESRQTRGKRKLHKSQISTPDLIAPPDRPMMDIKTPSLEAEAKGTRSRTKLIQQHLSGGTARKTRSRNTKI